MDKKKKEERREQTRTALGKTAKGLKIVVDILLILFGLFMLGVLIFVGVGLWNNLFAPLFGLA